MVACTLLSRFDHAIAKCLVLVRYTPYHAFCTGSCRKQCISTVIVCTD
jgi:hypothetical protein